MDKRKNYYITIDTETCNGIIVSNKLDLSQSFVYDIGIAVHDKKGKIYEKYSFVIDEIFYGMQDLMQSCYYKEKIKIYFQDIAAHKRKVCTIYSAKKLIKELCEKYNIKAICAYNARFDLNSLNNTIRYVSKSKVRYFFPYGVEIWDTLKMTRDIYNNRQSYINFCQENNYLTNHKKPQNQLKAEVVYRYLTGDNEFIESHTGLEDVKIEIYIFANCFKQHKKMRKLLFERA